MDVLTKDQRRKNMQAIRATGTKQEVRLAKALWNRGYRYRKNNKAVFGKPDLTFKRWKIAIFVDSEFFHGWKWDREKFRIKTNKDFWWRKIERNRKRDKQVNRYLNYRGWIVIRFWSKKVEKDLEFCVNKIIISIEKAKD